MKLVGCFLALLAGCGSCSGSTDEAPQASGPRRGVPTMQEPATNPQPPNEPAAEPTAAPATRPAEANPTAQATAEAKPAEETAESEKKRDYAAELQSAITAPVECLKPREGDDSPAEIKVELEAYFLATGAASRAYARSSALDSDELACIRKRLDAVRLAAPIEGAPLSVRTTYTFKLRTPDNSAN